MPTYQKDIAICLRTVDFSESSQVVTLFTRDHGLLPAIAKGSRRRRGAGAGGGISGPLDLLAGGELMFVARHGADLSLLTGWDVTDYRPALRTDMAAMNRGLLCAEITLLLLQPHDPHAELFAELSSTLEHLAGPEGLRVTVAYCLAALEHAGLRPIFAACQICGKAIVGNEQAKFFPGRGTVACVDCNDGGGTSIMLPGGILLGLSRLALPRQLASLAQEGKLRPADPAALAMALRVLLDQIERATEHRLKARAMVEVTAPKSVARPAKP